MQLLAVAFAHRSCSSALNQKQRMSGNAVLISPTHIALLVFLSLTTISLSSSPTHPSNLRNVLITIHPPTFTPKFPRTALHFFTTI
jgi:hypothetical protein